MQISKCHAWPGWCDSVDWVPSCEPKFGRSAWVYAEFSYNSGTDHDSAASIKTFRIQRKEAGEEHRRRKWRMEKRKSEVRTEWTSEWKPGISSCQVSNPYSIKYVEVEKNVVFSYLAYDICLRDLFYFWGGGILCIMHSTGLLRESRSCFPTGGEGSAVTQPGPVPQSHGPAGGLGSQRRWVSEVSGLPFWSETRVSRLHLASDANLSAYSPDTLDVCARM